MENAKNELQDLLMAHKKGVEDAVVDKVKSVEKEIQALGAVRGEVAQLRAEISREKVPPLVVKKPAPVSPIFKAFDGKDREQVLRTGLRIALKEADTASTVQPQGSGAESVATKPKTGDFTPDYAPSPLYAFMGIYAPQVPENLLLNRVSTFNTAQPVLDWANEKITGEAKFRKVKEGTAYMDIEFVAEKSVAQSVAVYTKVAKESVKDLGFLDQVIKKTLQENLLKVLEARIWDNADTTTAGFKGIKQLNLGANLAVNAKDLKVPVASALDTILSSAALIEARGYTPTSLYLNPIDYYTLMYGDKDDKGSVLNYAVKGAALSGLQVERNGNVPAGHFLIGDVSLLQLAFVEGLAVNLGFENDDFSRGLLSLRADARVHFYITDANKGGLIYDAFSTLKTTLNKAK